MAEKLDDFAVRKVWRGDPTVVIGSVGNVAKDGMMAGNGDGLIMEALLRGQNLGA